VEEASPHQPQFSEDRQTAINRHKIACVVRQVLVELFDAYRVVPFDQRFNDCDPGLCDSQTR
jgi:hypothetical protein